MADVETQYIGRALPSGPLDIPITNDNLGATLQSMNFSFSGKPQFELGRHIKLVGDGVDPSDPRGQFKHLYALATPLVEEVPNSGNPSLKTPIGESSKVKNIFTDFKRHDLGPKFLERNFDGTITKEFMTDLWGVGSTSPYGHDGRSINLREVIFRHGGEAQASSEAFARLSKNRQAHVIEFLQSLVLFGPPDTASNLNPGDPNTPNFPQEGHGSIDLAVLFNDPTDPE